MDDLSEFGFMHVQLPRKLPLVTGSNGSKADARQGSDGSEAAIRKAGLSSRVPMAASVPGWTSKANFCNAFISEGC
ncbi:MAG: hypothetical protein ABI389_12810 [Rhodanobacter sp.]